MKASADEELKKYFEPMALIEQSLKEQCVYEAVHESTKSHWIIYIQKLMTTCVRDPNDQIMLMAISDECHEKVLKDLIDTPNDGLNIDHFKYT